MIAAAGEALFDARLGGGESCAGDEERRARDVVHPHLVAELDRRGLTTVLAADPHLEVGPPATPTVDAELDQLPHALLAEHPERIGRHEPPVQGLREKLCD